MYHKIIGLTGMTVGGGLAVTGLNLLYAALVAFVLTGAAFALGRIFPKRKTA